MELNTTSEVTSYVFPSANIVNINQCSIVREEREKMSRQESMVKPTDPKERWNKE